MAKGKKTDNETIYKVMLSYISTNNYRETGRILDIPESTVRKIIEDNKDKPEFAELCAEKKDEFIRNAQRIMNKAINLLEKRIDTALNDSDALDEIIDEIYTADNKEISNNKKRSIANKISRLQLNNLGEISTALGVLYDKQALARGEPTSNEKLTINIGFSD